jgi:RNA polymerase sigma factor (sigma-70 family)
LEVSALTKTGAASAHGRSPLLRLQSDEKLVALVRRGNQHAFEALVARYQARLQAFCRHMLASKEDAEDVLQEVFAAAFNAMLADDRPINVRPWLYRIARNRSLNHLRKATAIGVDSMDVHLSDHGLTTADRVHKREEFRLLLSDVQDLPETQRTALLLREIDALSYEQIGEVMETTVPSVKSLLVRARVSLAEAAEARLLSCDEVRFELGEVAEGLRRTSAPVRRHLRTCERCQTFRKQLRSTNRALAAVMPVAPLFLAKKLILAHLFGASAAGGGGAAAGAGGAAGGAAAGAAGSAAAASAAGAAGAAASGALQAGIAAVATKAAAGLAAAALVTAGAVEVNHHQHPARAMAAVHTRTAIVPAATPAQPVALASSAQPSTPAAVVAEKAARAGDQTAAANQAALKEAQAAATATPVPTPTATPTATPDGGVQHDGDTTTLPADSTGSPALLGNSPQSAGGQPQPTTTAEPGAPAPSPTPASAATPAPSAAPDEVVPAPTPESAPDGRAEQPTPEPTP